METLATRYAEPHREKFGFLDARIFQLIFVTRALMVSIFSKINHIRAERACLAAN